MEQFRFINFVSCAECIKKLKWYPPEIKLEFASQRNKLLRCKSCPNLIKAFGKLNNKPAAVNNEK